MLPFSLILVMTVMGSIASLFLKKAADSLRGDSVVELAICFLKTPAIYIGCLLYGTAAILNIIVLKLLDYSIVLPLTSFTYVWTIILAKVRLHEPIVAQKMVGMLAIVAGAILVSRF